MCWCKPCSVSVSIAQVRRGGVWACVCSVVLASYFSGVAVAFEWYFWWCMGGLLLVGVLVVVVAWHVVSSHDMGRYFSGVLHLRAQTQYTSIHNIKQSCTLVAHDISSAFPVLAGMTASVRV